MIPTDNKLTMDHVVSVSYRITFCDTGVKSVRDSVVTFRISNSD